MTQNVIAHPTQTMAPLANVTLVMSALEQAMKRQAHLPGMVTLAGPSGWGKSTAATFAAVRLRAYYVECKSSWTRKALLQNILKEMGIEPAKTIYDLTDQVAEQLSLSGRPLIIDEMDHIVEKKAVEIVRDIYEGSQAAILLIGEEHLPQKLKVWERFHGRMLEWIQAQPVSLDDIAILARLYCREVALTDDIMAHMHRLSHGSVRRVAVNLDKVRREALRHGWDTVSLQSWGDRDWYTGEAPARRTH